MGAETVARFLARFRTTFPVALLAISMWVLPAAFAGSVQPLLLDLAEDEVTATSAPNLGEAGPGSSVLSAPVLPDGRWRLLVWLETSEASESVAAACRELGFEVRSVHDRELDVVGSHERLRDLADIPGVAYVARPLTAFVPLPPVSTAFVPTPPASSATVPVPPSSAETQVAGRSAFGEVETEALETMRVPEFHALGFRGAGVRVGVVDVGFDGYLDRIGTELPRSVIARDFSGQGFNVGESHGTACAEVITDIAPECELYLAQIATTSDLREALEWFQEEDVEVLSHSLAWFLGGGDGTGPVADLATSAASTGLQWVTSSGNFRQSYWEGSARDSNGDGWIETRSSGSESTVGISPTSGNGSLSLVLSWNRWPESSDVSFQIDIFDGAVRVATSETTFDNDYPFAFRQVDFDAARTLTDPKFRVRSVKGSLDDIRLRVFRLDGGTLLESDRVEAGSLAVPADSPWTIAVGAYGYRSTSLESFSSHGPTGNDLMKPEVIAADGVSTSLARYPRFVGTSAACPHVAGTLALLLSASVEGATFDLHWSRNDLRDLLQAGALPLEEEEESRQGWGRVRLVLEPDPEAVAVSPLVVARHAPGSVTFRLGLTDRGIYGRSSDLTGDASRSLDFFDSAGRWLGHLPVTRRGDDHFEYDLERGSFEFTRGRYWARERLSGATTSFLWIR